MSISTVASGINNLTISGDGVVLMQDTAGNELINSSYFGYIPYQVRQITASFDINIAGSTRLTATMRLNNSDGQLKPAEAHATFFETTVADANAIRSSGGSSVAGNYDVWSYPGYSDVLFNGYESAHVFTLMYNDASPNRDIKFRGYWLVINGLGATNNNA